MKELFEYNSRNGRLEFFIIILISSGLIKVLEAIYLATESNVASIICVLFMFLIIYIQFCATVKRYNDLGKSGFFILLQFIPIINIYCFIILFFVKGMDRRNQYGRDSLSL